VDKQLVANNLSEPVTICHYPTPYDPSTRYTMTVVSEAVAQTHYQHGDTFGPCASGASSSSAAAAASSAASSAGATSSAASSSGGGGGTGQSSDCTTKFTVDANKLITIQANNTSVTYRNEAANITFGPGGPAVTVHACHSSNATSGNPSFSVLYGSNGNCKGTGNAYGTAVSPNGVNTTSKTYNLNAKLAVRTRGSYRRNGSLAFHEIFDSYPPSANDNHIHFYRNDDALLNYPSFGKQDTLKQLLTDRGYFNTSTQKVAISACQMLAVTELSDPNSQSADYQDNVMLMTFN
jgi:hypothetical protein